ncbi:MAG: DUF58 domain-containing protein [Actinobacteria bacterium]|nr:DUF58 domain-containing protein [Actinomycetota bacterium]
MLPGQISRKVKAIEIKTRQIVSAILSGEYHSVFKGQGLNFAEVRQYQFGDDIRHLDWKVSAKVGDPYVKLYEEERELTVILAVDLSGSGHFGSSGQLKVERAAEIAAVLGFSATRNNDHVGLLLFTDQVERYIPPKKGKNHIFRLLREIFYFKPQHKGTSIRSALDFLLKTQKKKAIIIMISDFIDQDYEQRFQQLHRRHDVLPLIISDEREKKLPKAGIVVLEDQESGELIYVNTHSDDVRQSLKNVTYANQLSQERFFKSIKSEPIYISNQKDYILPLIHYFKHRMKRLS